MVAGSEVMDWHGCKGFHRDGYGIIVLDTSQGWGYLITICDPLRENRTLVNFLKMTVISRE